MKTGKSKDHLQRVFLRFLYLIMGSILSLDSVMAQENLKVSGHVSLFSYQGCLSCDSLFTLSHLFFFVKHFFQVFSKFFELFRISELFF